MSKKLINNKKCICCNIIISRRSKRCAKCRAKHIKEYQKNYRKNNKENLNNHKKKYKEKIKLKKQLNKTKRKKTGERKKRELCSKHNIKLIKNKCSECQKIYHKNYDIKSKSITKICKHHKIEFYGRRCKLCSNESSKKSNLKNKGKIKFCKKHKIEFTTLKCSNCQKEKIKFCKKHDIKTIGKSCPECHKIRNRRYREKNKEKLKNKHKERYNNDISYKLRMAVSSSIKQYLKNNNLKKDMSIKFGLNYTIQKLKDHIENLFEEWMNWNNWTVYNPNTWDDNDPSTWTWQLDHIIPHSNFKYSSMDCEEFKKCWSLNNLRPYNAKLNISDGNRRKNIDVIP